MYAREFHQPLDGKEVEHMYCPSQPFVQLLFSFLDKKLLIASGAEATAAKAANGSFEKLNFGGARFIGLVRGAGKEKVGVP